MASPNMGQQGPQKPQGPNQAMGNVFNEIRTFVTRIRTLEERVNNLRRSFQVNEQNLIELNKKLNEETSTKNSEILDMKRDVSDMKNKMEMIIKELVLTAKKEDVEVINKYLNLWKPISFVTQDEVRKIVRSMLYDLSVRTEPRDDAGEHLFDAEEASRGDPGVNAADTGKKEPETDEKNQSTGEMSQAMSNVAKRSQEGVDHVPVESRETFVDSDASSDKKELDLSPNEIDEIKENILKDLKKTRTTLKKKKSSSPRKTKKSSAKKSTKKSPAKKSTKKSSAKKPKKTKKR